MTPFDWVCIALAMVALIVFFLVHDYLEDRKRKQQQREKR